jgi:hypothetical protein
VNEKRKPGRPRPTTPMPSKYTDDPYYISPEEEKWLEAASEPKVRTDREKCQGEATRYDTVSSGVYSLTLKCRACGFVVRHDWD